MVTLYTIFFRGIQQHSCSHNIGLHKNARVFNGTVYMALCREIHYNIKFFFLKQIHNKRFIRNITFDKFVIRFIFHWFQSFQIAGVGEQIQVYNLIIRVFIHHVMYKVSSDKTGTACY